MKLPTLKSRPLIASALCTALLSMTMATPAQAKMSLNNEQCNLSLNFDVTVEPKKLLVSDKGVEQYRVEFDKLYVQGQSVTLTPKQSQALQSYSDSLSTQVPEAIALVSEVMVIVNQSVTTALSPILGEQTSVHLDKMMQGIQTKVDTLAYRQGDKFYLGATDSSIEDTFNEEFEQEIEQMVMSSLGSLMMTIGSQIMSSEGGTFEEKMNAFSTKMDNVGKDIELQVESQTKTLEARADKLCSNFEGLMVQEKKLHQQIPQLSPYVIASNNVTKNSSKK
ncbi:YggN family protein [Shewanella sp. SR44-3]|uniref:YggN family protein n=1 Tax=Shewanella sp. SR44-3 TaxID=2760936 RepID=UPI0015FA4F34|nr:YggN family protein [Shewanella sp. SR44-3]MBB1269257.1 YggN family protein [Shewanella sp. SR44-3]